MSRINFNCTRGNSRKSAIRFCETCRKFICEYCFRDSCQDHVTRPLIVELRTIQIGHANSAVVLHLNQILKGTDGKFYLVDMDNKLLRQLDGSFYPIANCRLPNRPWGACSFQKNGKHKIAVTLRKVSKVVIVDVENDFHTLEDSGISMPPFNAPRQFVTPDRCRGIAYHRESDKLIVACGGNDSQVSEDVTEGPGKIVVFSTSGQMLFTMTQGVSQPFHVQVGLTGAIYVCDRDNGVLVHQLQANGELTATDIARNPGSAYTYTVTESRNQQLFVGCHLPATITQFNGDHKVGVILSESGGQMSESGGQIKKPLCVLDDTNGDTQRLIVTNEGSNNIQVFTIHYIDICHHHVTRPFTVELRTIQIKHADLAAVLHLNHIVKGTDGKFYLVDMDNNLVIQLDGNFDPIANCPLTDRPWAACSFQKNGKHTIAVTLQDVMKVVIIDVENDFRALLEDSGISMPPFNAPTRQFVTPDRCRGIAYHRESDKLIVACGGNDSQVIIEEPGKIIVFSTSGDKLFTMTKGLSQPFHVQVGYTGAIYVCDRDNGVLICQLQANGDLTASKTARTPDSAYTYTVSESRNQQLFVGCQLPATITQFNGDQKVGKILSESGGQIKKPLCVLDDTNGDTQRLIVTNEGSDEIQVFTIHYQNLPGI